jgi:hypothetical protein
MAKSLERSPEMKGKDMDTPQILVSGWWFELCFLEEQGGLTAPGDVFAKITKTNSI